MFKAQFGSEIVKLTIPMIPLLLLSAFGAGAARAQDTWTATAMGDLRSQIADFRSVTGVIAGVIALLGKAAGWH